MARLLDKSPTKGLNKTLGKKSLNTILPKEPMRPMAQPQQPTPFIGNNKGVTPYSSSSPYNTQIAPPMMLNGMNGINNQGTAGTNTNAGVTSFGQNTNANSDPAHQRLIAKVAKLTKSTVRQTVKGSNGR